MALPIWTRATLQVLARTSRSTLVTTVAIVPKVVMIVLKKCLTINVMEAPVTALLVVIKRCCRFKGLGSSRLKTLSPQGWFKDTYLNLVYDLLCQDLITRDIQGFQG